MDSLIDFHSHILPGVDDGSASMEESIALLQQESAQGISHVLLTPHFYALEETPEDFLCRRASAEAALRRELEKYKKLPGISVGAEVAYFRGIGESEAVRQLAVEGMGCILVELPPAPWPEHVYRDLERIWYNLGIIPVVAHVDRYIRPFRTHGIPERLAELPVLVQANASFFLDRRTSAMAMRMLKKDQIHLLGSDCHNLSTRKPKLGDAVEVIRGKLGREAIGRICEHQHSAMTSFRNKPEE